jgi:hypothetical protein
MGEADLAALERMGPALKTREARQRWAQGHEGLVWWVDGRPAHYYWITRQAAWLPYVARATGLVRPEPAHRFSLLPRLPDPPVAPQGQVTPSGAVAFY